MDEPRKTDAEIMAELPPVVREIIEKSDWQAKIRKIVAQRHYRVDQGAFLEEAVLHFMVGESTAEELATTAATELKLDPGSLQELMAQLDAEIFTPMKNELEQRVEANPEIDDLPDAIAEAGAVSSPFSGAEDDLEAMINAGDSLPAAPATPASATPAAPAGVDPMASVREKLAEPVIRPAEPTSEPVKPATPEPAKPADPYREAF